jgi:hypothetical protein
MDNYPRLIAHTLINSGMFYHQQPKRDGYPDLLESKSINKFGFTWKDSIIVAQAIHIFILSWLLL